MCLREMRREFLVCIWCCNSCCLQTDQQVHWAPLLELMVQWWWGCLFAKLYPTLCNPMDCSLPGSCVYRTSQAIIGEGNGTPLQSSCLENPMDGGARWAAVHGVAEGRTQLSNFTFTSHSHALEKEMAPHSSVLAWRIPGTGEPGGLPSMGSHRVGHD